MVHKAIDLAAPGDVIVVDAGGMLEQAIIGEIMTSLAAKRGVAGFVIDGAIRDARSSPPRPFPVYARGVTHRGPYKNGPGEINVPVSIGGHGGAARATSSSATATASSRSRRPTPKPCSPPRASRRRRKTRRSPRSRPARSTASGSTRPCARKGLQVLVGGSSARALRRRMTAR